MRNPMLTLALSSAVLIAGVLLSVPAEAALDSRTTHMTFDHPVRVPGATLPAGHYIFTVSTSHVVWIRNEDDSHVYGPYFTRSVQRLESTGTRKIMVGPAYANLAPALRGWFGHHRKRGQELVW